jgi:SAM-dependent methyltransferase
VIHERRASAYGEDFYRGHTEKSRSSAHVIVPMVMSLLPAKRVIDVGCGRGEWLAEFQENGVAEIVGLDGPWVRAEELAISTTHFRSVDLVGPWPAVGEFDLAVCLEVAEHLPKRFGPELIRRLTSLAPAVLFSAALVGQDGTEHINEQWPYYWKQLFAAHEFVRLDPIRRRVWMDPCVAWYYQQNVFLFVAQKLLSNSEVLRHEKMLADNCPFMLVHPKSLRPLFSLRSALRQMAGVAFEACSRRLPRWCRKEAQ